MSQEGSGLHQDRHGKRAAWSNGSQAAANDMTEVSSSERANVLDGHEQALITVAEVVEIPDANEHGETVEVGVKCTQVTVVETVVEKVVETSIVEITEAMPEAVLQGEVQEGSRDPVIEEQATIPEQIQREDQGVQTEEGSDGTDGEEASDEIGDSGEDSEKGNEEEELEEDEDIEEEDENAGELLTDEAVDEDDEAEIEAQEECEEEEEEEENNNDEDETDEELPPTFGEKLWDFFTT
jgi:hypothetical protein